MFSYINNKNFKNTIFIINFKFYTFEPYEHTIRILDY